MATKTRLRELSDEDLRSQLQSLRAEVREARFQYGITRTVANPARLRKAKKDIARILTLLHERQRKGSN